MYKTKWSIVIPILSSFLLFTSCLESTDDSLVTNDCAITNMVLGSLHRTVTTKRTNGTDTTYVTTIAGSIYPMYVDQLNRTIYNRDSLPLGTNIKAVVFSSISADGNVAYRTNYGNDSIYSASDSLDFTEPRLFTCYAYSGKQYLTYTVSVNVHKQDPELFAWNEMSTFAGLNEASEAKAISLNSKIYLFLQTSTGTTVTTISNTGETERSASLLGALPNNIQNIQTFNGRFWGINNTSIVVSTDGEQWTEYAPMPTPFTALTATNDTYLFATDNQAIYYSVNGATWLKDSLDSDASNLPTESLASAYVTMSFNNNFQTVYLSGQTATGAPVLWKKITDKLGENDDVWSYYPSTEEIRYPLPEVHSPSMINYDGKTIYVGCKNDTVSSFYVSEDAGRNWIPDTEVYIHPNNIQATKVTCVVDEDNYIWLFCTGTGKVWRGRINRLGFDDNQTSFTD